MKADRRLSPLRGAAIFRKIFGGINAELGLHPSVWNEALETAARKADKVIQVGLAAEIRALKR